MSIELSRSFIDIQMDALQNGEHAVDPDELPKSFNGALKEDASAMALIGRLQYANPRLMYSPHVILLVLALSRNIAEVIMWAYTLFEETRVSGATITLERLVHMFPFGFPTEEGTMKYWDSQKVSSKTSGPSMFGWSGDNGLDLPNTWRV